MGTLAKSKCSLGLKPAWTSGIMRSLMERQCSKEKVANSQVERNQQLVKRCCQSYSITISMRSRILHSKRETSKFQMYARPQRYLVPSQEPVLKSSSDSLSESLSLCVCVFHRFTCRCRNSCYHCAYMQVSA